MCCDDFQIFMADLGVDLLPGQSFRVVVTCVVDGDTLDVVPSQSSSAFRVRLDSIDAPEMDCPEGCDAQKYLVSLVSELGKPVTLLPVCLDRYDRVLGSLSWGSGPTRRDMGDMMLEAGFARRWEARPRSRS